MRAKELLKQEGLSFDEVVVADDDLCTRTELMASTGMKTFPQIFHGNRLIGDYSDLKRIFDETNFQQFR